MSLFFVIINNYVITLAMQIRITWGQKEILRSIEKIVLHSGFRANLSQDDFMLPD